MVSVTLFERTSMRTPAVFWERKTAAWPAELPPPITITSLAAAKLGLHEGRVVINSSSGIDIEVGQRGFVVLCSGGQNNRASRDHLPVVERDLVGPLVAVQTFDRVGDHDLRTEFL